MKKQTPTHLDKLDTVLKIFLNGSEAKINDNVPLQQLSQPEIINFLQTDFPSISLSDYELFLILNKLHYDKFIEVMLNNFYRLNYIGFIFIKDDGFTGAQKQDQKRISHENWVQYLLIIAGFLAGIGTVLLFGVEVYKIYHSCY